MQDTWHQMTADHALPTPDKLAGRKITPNDYVHDWEAGRRKESQLANAYNAT